MVFALDNVANKADFDKAKADGMRLIGQAMSSGADGYDVCLGLMAAIRESVEKDCSDTSYGWAFKGLLGELMGLSKS